MLQGGGGLQDFRILDFRHVVNRDKPRNFVTMILINDLGGREWSSNAMFVVKQVC